MFSERNSSNTQIITIILVGAAFLLAGYFYDIPLFRLINGHYSEFGDSFFSLVTCLGDGLVLGIFLFFLWSRSAVHTLLGLESLIASGILVRILKHSLASPRPPAVLEQVHLVGVEYFKSSFPSGHTTSAFAVGFLFYAYLSHQAPKALAIILAVLVGYSRVYLGLHFPVDVIAGAVAGLLCTKFILRQKEPLQKRLDAISNERRKLFDRIMMIVLSGGGLFLLLIYEELLPGGLWFGNLLGVSAFLTGLFFLWKSPHNAV